MMAQLSANGMSLQNAVNCALNFKSYLSYTGLYLVLVLNKLNSLMLFILFT